VDELDSELRTLDREIAQFVLEAFQREAPEALRAQLAAAMAEGLRPLQRSLEAIGGALAETRGDLARTAEDGARQSARQSASLQADIAGRAREAQEQAERRTAELQQALARMRSELALARREIQAAGLPGSAPGPADAEDAAGPPPAPPRVEGPWWSRSWAWAAGGAIAVAVAVAVTLVLVGPAGLFTARSPPGAIEGQTPATGDAPTAAGAPALTQDGFARVLARVSGGWSGERRAAALEALCGAAAAACPDLQKRWLVGGRSRKEVAAALAVTVAALAEDDGCASLSASPEPQPPHAGADRRRADAEPAVADADPLATWTCLLTEAGRGPRA
jgi:hypothetical protein